VVRVLETCAEEGLEDCGSLHVPHPRRSSGHGRNGQSRCAHGAELSHDENDEGVHGVCGGSCKWLRVEYVACACRLRNW
jgi:hypothetical protein